MATPHRRRTNPSLDSVADAFQYGPASLAGVVKRSACQRLFQCERQKYCGSEAWLGCWECSEVLTSRPMIASSSALLLHSPIARMRLSNSRENVRPDFLAMALAALTAPAPPTATASVKRNTLAGF